jgi:ATP-dependent protease HslVU (ClpYQ) peptidase subunit
MVLRHIRQGEAHVAGQHKIVARLHLAGCSTDAAYDLLAQFENTLRLHKGHLDRLLHKS